jgi:hypothetical protein
MDTKPTIASGDTWLLVGRPTVKLPRTTSDLDGTFSTDQTLLLYPQALGDESGQLMVDGPSGSRNSDGVADVLCELEEFT